jgi:peroxiredoxin family protein
MPGSVAKVSIVVTDGSLDGVYPALIMASGARAEGIEANLFFTRSGLEAVSRKRSEQDGTEHSPGTRLVPAFVGKTAETGAGIYGCQGSCVLGGLGREDLIDEVRDIIPVGEFYALAAGGHVIFT